MLLIAGGPFVAAAALASLAAGIRHFPPPAIGALVSVVGFGIGSSSLHLTAWAMAVARAGEESLTAGSIPTVRSLGIAFGAAVAGLVANSAGLHHGIDAPHVAAAATWVMAIGSAAPAVSGLLALRIIALRSPTHAPARAEDAR
jgi:hypothetical protein